MREQGNEALWCIKCGRSILILPNPSLHWPCNHSSGASESKAANVNPWLLEARLFNLFLLYVLSWLKTQLAASLCSQWACPCPSVITSGHCPWEVPLAGWCWELISDLAVTGSSSSAAHVEEMWIQTSLQQAGAFVQMWNSNGRRARCGCTYSAANNVAMVMLTRVSWRLNCSCHASWGPGFPGMDLFALAEKPRSWISSPS